MTEAGYEYLWEDGEQMGRTGRVIERLKTDGRTRSGVKNMPSSGKTRSGACMINKYFINQLYKDY